MATRDKQQEIGWMHSVNENDPITSNDEENDGNAGARYWLFGDWTYELNQFHPTEVHDWKEIYKSNRTPADIELISTALNMDGFLYYPTNAVPLYLILGASSTATGVHTLTPIESGSLPEICVRSQSIGGTVPKYFSGRGVKISSLSNHLNLLGDWHYMTESITYGGIKTATPSLQEAHTPDYPTNNYNMAGYIADPGVEQKDQYVKDPNFEFGWDSSGGAGGDDYSSELALFNHIIINNHEFKNINAQAEIEYIREKHYQFMVTFNLWRGDAGNIKADFEAKTKHEMYMKIYNNATDYRHYIWSDVGLSICQAPRNKPGDPPLWLVQGVAKGLQIKGKDGVSLSFYEE